MSEKLNTLATEAFKLQKKPSKHEAMDAIETLVNQHDASPELVKLYKWFTPPVPAKPKTSEQWVAKACAKDDDRHWLCRLHVDGDKLIATDGHRMHWCDTYRAEGAYDTQFNVIAPEDAGKFPDWRRVIPRHGYHVPVNQLDVSNRYKDPKTGRFFVVKLTLPGNVEIHINSQYLDDALCGMNDNAVLYYDKPNDSIPITDGASCHAVVMPIRNAGKDNG